MALWAPVSRDAEIAYHADCRGNASPCNRSYVLKGLAGLILAMPAVSADAKNLGSPEAVHIWKQDKCDADDVPDSPARAVRLADGSVVLVAAHHSNRILQGPSLQKLSPTCQVVAKGAENADPSRIDDRYWIQALVPLSGNRMMGLVSHEYMGKRHPEFCRSMPTRGTARCWYSTIAVVTGTQSPFALALAPDDRRVMAAPPTRYDPDRKDRIGFFTVSNIVRRDNFAYVFSYSELEGQRGNCLFRTDASNPVEGWKARSGGSFVQAFPSAYRDPTPVARKCDVIAPGVFTGPIRSVVWISRLNKWMAVGTLTNRNDPESSGVFYSLSADLVNWSPRSMLFPSRQPWGNKECSDFYEYPSLIDHSSKSNIFDTVDGDDLYLYLTRFNYTSCKKGLDRDLVRFKVPLETISLGAR